MQISLAEILGALSKALDITEGQPAGHSVRCCWIGVSIGLEHGIKGDDLSDLYYAVLLKDLGCSSNASKVCSVYLTDDIVFKRDFKTINGNISQALHFLLTHIGQTSGLIKRIGSIINVLGNAGDIAKELIETRCYQGAKIARKLRFSDKVAEGIRCLDEHWDGTGLPDRLKGNEIPTISQIALMAQIIDVFSRGEDPDLAIDHITNRSGTWFDPSLVRTFEKVSQKREFWDTLSSDTIQKTVFAMEASQIEVTVDDCYLDDIASAFAEVIDAKSPFTYGQSERVAFFADQMAQQLGLNLKTRRLLKRGALLHDIGKLGISNTILDKSEELTSEEKRIMKQHPLYSSQILSGVDAFRDILPIARSHHERLDGKGYPDRLPAEKITLETRIITVADIYVALTANRPYRRQMSESQAVNIMEEEFATAIDPECLSALKLVIERLGQLAA